METFFPAYLIVDTYLRMVTKIYLCQTETFQIFSLIITADLIVIADFGLFRLKWRLKLNLNLN